MVSNRLADVVIGRIIDLLILTLHGAAALGLYSIGARVYQTAMQLFTGALADISLSAVFRIAGDIDRPRAAYLRSISLATIVVSSLFVVCAALAPDLSGLLFGICWAGSESVMPPSLLLGAVQCVQFMNGPFLEALGRSGIVLALNAVKFVAISIALTIGSNHDIGEMTTVFAFAQVAVTPLTFGWIAVMLRIPALPFVRTLA